MVTVPPSSSWCRARGSSDRREVHADHGGTAALHDGQGVPEHLGQFVRVVHGHRVRAAGRRDPDTAPIPVIVVLDAAPPPWQPLLALAQVPARIWRGRPLRLLLRAAAAGLLSLLVLQLIPGSPAAPADVLGLALWFVLTARSNLAPPPER